VKKFLIMAGLALGVAAVSWQQASAWIKCNFSVGLNWCWESGNNSFLWGAWTSGQVPGSPTDVGCCHGFCGVGGFPGCDYGGYGGYGGYGDHGYPSGYGGHGYPSGDQAPGYQAPAPTPADKDKGGKEGGTSTQAPSWYGNSAYQPAGYYQAPSYYQAPAAYYPSYNYYGGYSGYGYYGNRQAPSYWYGN
jgi:hypothetical protein